MAGAVVFLLLFIIKNIHINAVVAESDDVQMKVQLDGQTCSAELNKCSMKNEYGRRSIDGDMRGEKGEKGFPGFRGTRGEDGNKGIKGDRGDNGPPGYGDLTKGSQGICEETCTPVLDSDSRTIAPLGSKDRPSPLTCKFLPEDTDSGPVWMMESKPFQVFCDRPNNNTCLILDYDFGNEETWYIFFGLGQSRSDIISYDRHSQQYENVLNYFYKISEDQMHFLKRQSDVVTQEVKVYIEEDSLKFKDLDFTMRTWNGNYFGPAVSAESPLEYNILDDGQIIEMEGGKWIQTHLQFGGSARSLPVIDFKVKYYVDYEDNFNMVTKITKLCFN